MLKKKFGCRERSNRRMEKTA